MVANNPVSQERHKSNMEVARLEHALLQTVINHVAEEHLTRSQIVMALLNVAAYWQRKIINDALSRKVLD